MKYKKECGENSMKEYNKLQACCNVEHSFFRTMISCILVVGLVCSGFSGKVAFAAETTDSIPTIRLYLQKPDDWGTPAIHIWNEDAVVEGDGTVFVKSWNTSKAKLYKDASSGLYYVDITLKSWYGFQIMDAENEKNDKEIRVDKDVEADAKVLAAFSQMTEDTSVYYLNMNGTYGWYLDVAGTKPLELPGTVYANIHFYNEEEWETPCIDVWANGAETTYSNVGAMTAIKGWDHKLPSMKAEEENWYTATIQVNGKLSGMQFVDAKTGTIRSFDSKQLATVDACTKETATDLYYGYGVLSNDKKDIPIPKKLVKRQSPIYNADGTVTFHLATEEEKAGIKGTFTNWITMPMEAVSDAEDGFEGFTAKVKVPTEGGIYTYGMVTGEAEQWVGDTENKTKTDNPAVVRNPEIGNGTVTIYWPSTKEINGKVSYRKYGSKDTYSEEKFKTVADAENLYAAVIEDTKAGETYEYTISIDGKEQEDIYNFASKENGGATFISSKKVSEPDYESPVIQEDGTVTFCYWNPSAKEVKLAGDMTNWAADAVVMEKDEETGLFSVTISVAAGTYGYKYIVDGNWVLDEKNKKTTDGTDIASLLEIAAKETPEPTTEPTITPIPQVTDTLEPTKTPIPQATVTLEPTGTPEVTPSVVPTATTTITPTAPTIITSPTVSPVETATPIPKETVTPSLVPSIEPTVTAEPEEMSKYSYKITYVLNKGTNHKSNPESYSTENVTLKAPKRMGYAFGGWYTDKNFSQKVIVINASLQKDITVYAKWTKVQKPAKVKKITVTNKKGKKMKISIRKIVGAKGYEVVYARDKKFKKSLKKVNITGTTKTIRKLRKKQSYYVKVRAYKIDSAGMKVYGSYSSVKKVKITK